MKKYSLRWYLALLEKAEEAIQDYLESMDNSRRFLSYNKELQKYIDKDHQEVMRYTKLKERLVERIVDKFEKENK